MLNNFPQPALFADLISGFGMPEARWHGIQTENLAPYKDQDVSADGGASDHFSLAERVALAESQRALHHDLGNKLGLRGPSIYNPFGGSDVHTPFTLVPDAVDVFQQGIDSGGSVCDLQKWQSISPADRLACIYNTGFDSIRFYEHLHEQFGLDGLLALALARITTLLQGSIVLVSFLKIETNPTRIKFETADSIDDETRYPHFLIAFKTPDSDAIKRYWYFQHDLYHPNAFKILARELPADTLMLKGVPRLFRGSARRSAIDLALSVARERNSVVLTDIRLNRRGHELDPGFKPYDIWRSGFQPEEVLVEGLTFGYSRASSKDPVYRGMGNDLIDSEMNMLSLARAGWETVVDFFDGLSLLTRGGY